MQLNKLTGRFLYLNADLQSLLLGRLALHLHHLGGQGHLDPGSLEEAVDLHQPTVLSFERVGFSGVDPVVDRQVEGGSAEIAEHDLGRRIGQ